MGKVMAMEAEKPSGSEGTGIVVLTHKHSSRRTTSFTGTVVKNDANLKSFIKDGQYVNKPDDLNLLEGTKYWFYIYDSESLIQENYFKATISCYRYTKSEDKTCEIENPHFVIVDKHAFLLCNSDYFNGSNFLKENSKMVSIIQCLDKSKTVCGLSPDLTKKSNCKFTLTSMSQTCREQNMLNITSTNEYEKLEDAGPILLSSHNNGRVKVVVGGYRKTSNSKITYSLFGENQDKKVAHKSSLTDEQHSNITSSTSKTNPSCNGTPSRNDFLSRNDNPSSNCIPSSDSTASNNCSQKGSDLETDHSDGSQSSWQMISDDLIEEGEQRLNGEPDLTHTEEEENSLCKFFRLLEIHILKMLDHRGVKEGLCERLDPEYKELPNWEHLADHLKAPTSVKEEGRSYTKYSPTELLFEVPKVSSVTVNSLLMALRDIKRYDVYNKIIKVIPENERNMKVSETLLTDDHLLDEVAVMLDTPRKGFRNNWEVLGFKLGVARDDLDQIKRGNNPANQLLQYAYRKLEAKNLKAGYFYGLFLEREDIKIFLDGLGITPEDNRSIKDIFKPNSRNMGKLCALLNTNLCGTANNWRYLAYKWGIEGDNYDKFDKTYQEKPSPTGKLLNWLMKEHPSFTVGELCEHLEEMGRSDVKDFLLEKAHKYYDVRR